MLGLRYWGWTWDYGRGDVLDFGDFMGQKGKV
jgi:hypothetical protein